MTRKIRQRTRDLLNSAAHGWRVRLTRQRSSTPRPSAPSGVRVEQRVPVGTRFSASGPSSDMTLLPGTPRLSDPVGTMITGGTR